ncbi:pyridoxamine 5'-phosphate oxidase family protein [Streptomyces sp. DSM 44915]|uniref:Pyridoxamine 5'-phosphate oxidase family protein n=1 Tax=Streptomyces chisholmiae TaxID=3075540 RepID=A0ABU2JQR1_9ACTN|nr:pyridoxamine 5'-phosphate oxidase family protein [Streptomyces sp. DSM 44915]MDT0267069.1 pyridoxamine 5'-phosphate oxidase family protein [Streptomyces sp. DSM 44915]
MAGTVGNGWPAALATRAGRPGSDGEHALQARLGSERRADRFYRDQVLDHLNERMREFVAEVEMFFLATADRHGECDNTFRAGPPGFLRVLDPRTLVYPEYRGNGVHASLGNLAENPHAGLLLLDFDRARIGLHVNGRARMVTDAELRAAHPDLPVDPVPGRRTEIWVRIEVVEAYIHCAKHIPHLVKAPRRTSRDWGTDDQRRKGGDFFGAARDAQLRRTRELRESRTPPPLPDPAPAPAAPVPAALTPAAPAPDPVPPSPDAAAWRAEALRALERARRAEVSDGATTPTGGGGSWFG